MMSGLRFQLPGPGQWQWKFRTLEGSFSSVSTPNFTSEYSFFSIFRDLSDSHSFAPLQIQNLQIFPFFAKKLRIFAILQTFAEFSLFFFEIFTEFCRNFGKLHQSNVQFPGELGIRRIGELGIRNRMPGIGNWQSSKFEISGQFIHCYGYLTVS